MTDSMLIGIVSKVDETRKGPKVWLHVLRGQLAQGDEIEVVHSDCARVLLAFTNVGKNPVTPDNVTKVGYEATFYAGPFKQNGVPAETYRVGDLVRAPDGPPIEADPASPLAVQIASARAAGLNVAGPHLSDGIVALHVQWVMDKAVKGSKGVVTASGGYSWAAKVLEGYGLIEQADRATLLSAALLEGYEPSPGVRGLASLGAGVANAFSVDPPMLVRAVGLAIEEGDQFAKSYRNSLRVTGEAQRVPLMDQSRAVAIGWCRKCGDVTPLDKKLRCQICGKESERFRVVIPTDKDLAEQELRTEGPPPKRGLFG